MTVIYHTAFEQGSDEWLQARRGILTASEMKLIITPTLKVAANDKSRAHLWELLAQRVTGYVEPHYVSDDMLRGHEDEIRARLLYAEHYAPVTECGFITNNRWGFTLGYSPDALVGDDGLIECKSRRQKYQVQTIVENVATGTAPDDYVIQIQTGLLVSERSWCDFISYSGGLPCAPVRIEADPEIQEAIVNAATVFEAKLAEQRAIFDATVSAMIPTERVIEVEMYT